MYENDIVALATVGILAIAFLSVEMVMPGALARWTLGATQAVVRRGSRSRSYPKPIGRAEHMPIAGEDVFIEEAGWRIMGAPKGIGMGSMVRIRRTGELGQVVGICWNTSEMRRPQWVFVRLFGPQGLGDERRFLQGWQVSLADQGTNAPASRHRPQ